MTEIQEKKKKKSAAKRVGCILLCAALIIGSLWFLQQLFMPKYMHDIVEGAMIAEYYQEEKDHDVIFVGDCELYENISPQVLWDEYGINSYIRGSAQQLIWQSYYLMEETLRYEKPKAIVFNVLSLKYNEPQKEAYNRMTLDGMRWSMSKVHSIEASMLPEENFIEYVFPILRYHSRYSSLTEDDLTYLVKKDAVTHNGYYMRVDVRPADQYSRGTFPGAISIPMDEFDDKMETVGKEKTVYVLCHTGDRSQECVEKLTEAGYDAVNVDGGYRAYLRLSLSRFMADDAEEKKKEKTKEIEHSIIKTFRKTIWRPFTKALNEYQLIQEGDKVAVCISGGKDSMLMAKLIQELQRHGKIHFEAVFLVMNPGYNADNWKIIQENAKLLGIPLTVFESNIFDTVAEIDRNPCYLCARMRRGYLYSHAKELGCNKIALGHHFDDVIETILMGMLYSGKVETMMPKLHSQNFEGMELIRPMYLIKESAIKAWRDTNGLHFIQCACRFTENCVSCGGGRGSKRDEMKELVAQFRNTSSVIETNIFNSVRDINLRTVMGYHKDGEYYNFLDDYDQRGNKGADKEKE